MIYPSKEEVETYTAWDRIGVVAAIAIVTVLLFADKHDTDTKIGGLATGVMRGNDWQREVEKRLRNVEQKLYFPLFYAHARNCPQCGSDTPTDDGPPALCEDGFKLFQQDMRNNNDPNEHKKS